MISQKNVVPDEEHQAAAEDAVGEEHPEAEEDSDEGEVGVRQGAEDSAVAAAAALADEALEEAEVHREVVVDLEAVVVAVVVTVVHDLVCVPLCSISSLSCICIMARFVSCVFVHSMVSKPLSQL